MKKRHVYIDEDNGQPFISLRWVISQKVNGERTFPKRRILALGFEEQNFRMDSSTCSRGVRISLTCIVTHRWKVNIIDMKIAFLQGKTIERTFYVRPPKQNLKNQESSLWPCCRKLYMVPENT